MTTGLLWLAAIVLLGSCVQWLTGMGFALVAVPGLILLLGPAQGVVLANCASGVICAVGLTRGRREVRWAAMVPLCMASVCTVPLGAWTTRHLPEPVLLIVMGGLVTAAVLLILRGVRAPALRGRAGAVGAGAAGGFMNAAAGVGGPPVSLYALNAGWTVREFVPNAQLYGLFVNIFSVWANGVPRLSGAQGVGVTVAMAAGMLIGRALADRTPETRARTLVLALALGGGVTTLLKGVLEL